MSEPRRFTVQDGADLSILIKGLEQRAPLDRDPDRQVERTVYDTFDWRFHAKGTVLELERTTVDGQPAPAALVWRSLDTGEVLGRVFTDEVPRFLGELPAGPTTDRLVEVTEMRVVYPLATYTSHQRPLRLVDGEQKTMARLVVEEVAMADRTVTAVEVVPLRGYERDAAGLGDLLAAQVLLKPTKADVSTKALRRAGHTPGGYSSKLKLRLNPDDPALDAFAGVLSTLLDTVVVNEPGTRSDDDSEYLHDFRVAIRRTRSVLGMAKGVIPPVLLDHLRRETKWVGDVTTPTRDLDVYLLDFPGYKAELPPAIAQDLAPLGQFLVERQRLAHDDLVRALDSARYVELMARYRQWLADPWAEPHADDPELVIDADRPAPEVAAARTWKIFRRLLADGRLIGPDSPAEWLHDLRKDGKKLRYALECFGSLFPDHDVAPLIRELKGVQDVLGRFQDGEVQSASLRQLGRELVAEGIDDPSAVLMAMGFLLDQFEQRQHEARAEFASRFEAFDNREVRRHFRAVFGPRPTPQPAPAPAAEPVVPDEPAVPAEPELLLDEGTEEEGDAKLEVEDPGAESAP